jgi:hypothetical protein
VLGGFKVAMPTEGLNRGDFREYRERIVEAIRAGSEDWSLAKTDGVADGVLNVAVSEIVL